MDICIHGPADPKLCWQCLTREIDKLRRKLAISEEACVRFVGMVDGLHAALEQAIDDFGEGHCVCEATKQMCIEAAGVEQKAGDSK